MSSTRYALRGTGIYIISCNCLRLHIAFAPGKHIVRRQPHIVKTVFRNKQIKKGISGLVAVGNALFLYEYGRKNKERFFLNIHPIYGIPFLFSSSSVSGEGTSKKKNKGLIRS